MRVNDYDIDASIREWIEYSNVSDKSKNTYLKAVEHWFRWLHLKGIDVKIPTRQNFKAYKNTLSEKYKGKTSNLYMTSVRQYYKHCKERGYVDVNIAEGVPCFPWSHDIAKEPLTDKEIETLLNSIDKDSLIGLRDYAIIYLMIATGLRRIEVFRLRNSDVIWSRNQLKIQRKGRGDKITFWVTDEVMQCLKEYVDARDNDLETISHDGSLFVSHGGRSPGKQLSLIPITKMIGNRMKSVGLDSKYYTAHSLRHTTASIALSAGVDVTSIMAMLGHTSLKTTSIYLEAVRRHLECGNPSLLAIRDRLNHGGLDSENKALRRNGKLTGNPV